MGLFSRGGSAVVKHRGWPIDDGLTLFETLIATAVLGMVFLGLLAAMGDSFIVGRAAYTCSRSQNLATRVMEETIENDFDDLLGLDGNVIEEGVFTATINVVESARNLRLIEVTVTSPNAHLATTRLLTYRARR